MTELPTAREALARAVDAARNGDSELADVWTYIASEIRKGSRGDRKARPLRSVTHPPDRLTLHDVEGIVCAHGRVAVRPKAGPGTWFLHTDDGTTCDAPEEGTEWQRRITAGDVDPVPLSRDVPTETVIDRGPDGELRVGQRFVTGMPLLDEARHMEDSLSQAVIGDRMVDYHRGQASHPSFIAYSYALDIANAIARGDGLPEGIPRDAAESLAAEIIQRGAEIYDPARVISSEAHGEAEATARMDLRDAETTLVQRTSLRTPAYVGTLEDPQPLCVHCAQPIVWVAARVVQDKAVTSAGWIHAGTGQVLCQCDTSEGDEDHRPTPALTVAWPGEVPYTGIQPESL